MYNLMYTDDLIEEFEEHLNTEFGDFEVAGIEFKAGDILRELHRDAYLKELGYYIQENFEVEHHEGEPLYKRHAPEEDYWD